MPYRQFEDPQTSYYNPKPYRGSLFQGEVQFCPQDETNPEDLFRIIYTLNPETGTVDFCPQDELVPEDLFRILP